MTVIEAGARTKAETGRAAETERADVLAYIRQRQRSAALVAGHNPEEAERAQIIVQQMQVMAEFIEQGLHEDSAAVVAAIDSASVGSPA